MASPRSSGGLIQSIAGVSIENRYSRTSIVCHELGHALGLGHWYSPVSCMHPGPSRAGRPRAHDYAALAAQYGTP